MHFFQILSVNMGIDLGGDDVRMAQHFLDRAKVGPAFKKVSGEGMPERMGGNFLFDPCFFSIFFNDFPDAHARYSGPPDI